MRRLLVAGVAILAALAFVSAAEAAFPGQNGKIAFSSTRDGNHEIYSINANGSGVTRLTITTCVFKPTTFSSSSWRGGPPDGHQDRLLPRRCRCDT